MRKQIAIIISALGIAFDAFAIDYLIDNERIGDMNNGTGLINIEYTVWYNNVDYRLYLSRDDDKNILNGFMVTPKGYYGFGWEKMDDDLKYYIKKNNSAQKTMTTPNELLKTLNILGIGNTNAEFREAFFMIAENIHVLGKYELGKDEYLDDREEVKLGKYEAYVYTIYNSEHPSIICRKLFINKENYMILKIEIYSNGIPTRSYIYTPVYTKIDKYIVRALRIDNLLNNEKCLIKYDNK